MVMAAHIEEMQKHPKEFGNEIVMYRRVADIIKNRNYVSMLENGTKELVR